LAPVIEPVANGINHVPCVIAEEAVIPVPLGAFG
jgi:hypothetical protein